MTEYRWDYIGLTKRAASSDYKQFLVQHKLSQGASQELEIR